MRLKGDTDLPMMLLLGITAHEVVRMCTHPIVQRKHFVTLGEDRNLPSPPKAVASDPIMTIVMRTLTKETGLEVIYKNLIQCLHYHQSVHLIILARIIRKPVAVNFHTLDPIWIRYRNLTMMMMVSVTCFNSSFYRSAFRPLSRPRICKIQNGQNTKEIKW